MPTNTTYLNMSLYNSTTDGSATFASWRAAIDGVSPTSNFNVLDTYAQNTSASITALQVKSFYLVPAVYVSPNYYEANSLTSITAYTTGMYLDIYLDTTNVGSVTLNINALGTKTLKKVDATGALVDLASSDLEKNKEYLFRYNGTYFVWVAVSSGTGGTTYSGSALITITGSKISHTVSGVIAGTYTSADLTVDDYGHLTAVSNGASASSTGAPSDTPFLVSGSVSVGVTNAKQLVAGSYMSLTPSGSTLIVATTVVPLTAISGSGIMSDSTGSSVKHNVSGVTAGSANKIQYDKYGHIISASIIAVPQTATITAGQALQTYDSTTGAFGKVAIATDATGVAGKALYSYAASTGSFANVPIPLTAGSVSGKVLQSYNSITGSFTNVSADYIDVTTNSNYIFYQEKMGASGWTGTINGTPSGSLVTYTHVSGNQNTLDPASTTQIGKQRLYNTTRSDYALISTSNGSSVITLTASAPASWASGDTITTLSPTVNQAGWVDIEIVSGASEGAKALALNMEVRDTASTNYGVTHPYEAYASSKMFACYGQVANKQISSYHIQKYTSNVISVLWAASGSATGKFVLALFGEII